MAYPKPHDVSVYMATYHFSFLGRKFFILEYSHDLLVPYPVHYVFVLEFTQIQNADV